MHLLDGKALADQILQGLLIAKQSRSYTPTLAVLLVGNDPASHLYVKMKQATAEKIGFSVQINHLSEDVSDEELIAKINVWNEDANIDGILVQVPLPDGHDESKVIQAMDPRKDVDGFHAENVAALLAHSPTILSPVHEGVLRLIQASPAHVNGAQVSLIANSTIFSEPLAHLLTTAGAHVRTMSGDELDRDWLEASDIVVIAIGRPGFLIPAMVSDDAVLIDVGTTRDDTKKVRGDVDRLAFEATDCTITPVPGGVGPMTIAILMKNLLQVADQAHNYTNES